MLFVDCCCWAVGVVSVGCSGWVKLGQSVMYDCVCSVSGVCGICVALGACSARLELGYFGINKARQSQAVCIVIIGQSPLQQCKLSHFTHVQVQRFKCLIQTVIRSLIWASIAAQLQRKQPG